MLTKVFIYGALFLTSALGAAVPAALESPSLPVSIPVNAMEICAQRGINIHGPIPSDATPTEGGFTFTAGSDAALWVQAQISLASSGDLAKREFANIGIGMFSAQNCLGDGAWFDNVQYQLQNVAPRNFFYQSLGISYRALGNEQLDISRRGSSNADINDYCHNFLKFYGPGTGIGCYNQEVFSCFRLTRR